ncbi:MAG: tRNA (guanosine(46)-N7)-methyltransferase TrmB [Deltaproteobacteria bacterium]|nr:tRNA (guanosine(46)-N7)-methyltransferase TrmB [Deltaproteobacteria bacterium]
MSRRLRYDIPGPDRRVALEELRAKGWEALFPELPRPLRLVLEIGFGRGEFLAELAAGAPAVAHVGVERSWKRVLKMARRLARSELANVRLVHGAGEDVVRDGFGAGSLDAVWINFSDPWPKKRHHRRRLVQPALVAALAERLRPGGLLHVATDDAGYAEHIDAVLGAEPRLANAFAPARWLPEVPGRTPTAYELAWRAEGRALHFWAYRRVDEPEPLS